MKTAFKQKDGSVKWIGYQDLPGVPGDRKIQDRIKFFNKIDFKDKSVLDVGCWGGQMMLQAKEWGATKVEGVEIDRDAIKLGRGLGLEIIRDDIENPFFWREIPHYDTILLLAILGNMQNKEAVLSQASQKANVLYVEGHGRQHKFSRADYMNLFLKYTDFKTIEYLGDITTRPFFRLSREEKTIDYIKSRGYKRIAIIGKPGAGKTYYALNSFDKDIDKKVIRRKNELGITQFTKEGKHKIYSDIKEIGKEERIIVDNHGALTLTDYDCVVNIISSRRIRLKRIAERIGTENASNRIKEFSDTVSPLYKKGAFSFYTIINK
jgi:SAM-dependent methyltransferase